MTTKMFQTLLSPYHRLQLLLWTVSQPARYTSSLPSHNLLQRRSRLDTVHSNNPYHPLTPTQSMNALSYKEQLEKLSKLVRDSPLSQGEQTVWKLSASRTGFKRPTLLPPPKCLPISAKDVQGKLAVREATYKAAAPAKFIAELQK